ncbi:MAG TPA: hypothetical protein VIH99_13975 [Bdellovibrionota bacterium]
MKTLFALTLALTTFASAQAAPVLQAVRNPGFERFPQKKTFTLDSSGKMTREIRDFRENTTTVENLGQLTKAGLAQIMKQVERLDMNDKLVDPKEGTPQCTDTPSYSTTVFKDGQAKEIYRSAGCHTWILENRSDGTLNDFAMTMLF